MRSNAHAFGLTVALVLGSSAAQGSFTFLADHHADDRDIESTDVVQHPSGDYFVCGRATDLQSRTKPYVTRLRADGSVMWYREYEVVGANHYAVAIEQVAVDGGDAVRYAVLMNLGDGQETGLLTIDPNGDVTDMSRYQLAATGSLLMNRVIRVSSGGYLLVGTASDTVTGQDIVLIRIDTGGAVLWTKRIAGIGLSFDYSDNAREAADGSGFFVMGSVENMVWLGKVDHGGGIVSQQHYDLQASGLILASSLEVLERGPDDLLLLGNFLSRINNLDVTPFIARLDGAGNLLSTTIDTLNMGAYRAVLTTDGGFAFLGFRKLPLGVGEFAVAKLDRQGELQWGREYLHLLTLGQLNLPQVAGIQTDDGGFAVVATTSPGATQPVLKIDSHGLLSCDPTGVIPPPTSRTMNPTSISTTVTVPGIVHSKPAVQVLERPLYTAFVCGPRRPRFASTPPRLLSGGR